MATASAQMQRDLKQTVQLLAAILMALGSVITSWCAFQASIWKGIQTFSLAEANQQSRLSMNKHLEANQLRMLDVQMFEEFVQAHLAKNEELASFYQHRFRPEMKVAFDAWMKTHPFEAADAPPHPFAMPEYRSALEDDSQRLQDNADRLFADARKANRTSDIYTLSTVLFAMVLLFAGISTTMIGSRQQLMLGTGAVLFLVVAVWVSTLEVSFGSFSG